MSAILTIRYSDDVAVVEISGRITLGDASNALRDTIRGLVAEGRAKILLNLSNVSFMDSAGIGELASAHVSMTHKRGRLKLYGLTKRMRDLLQVTRLYTVLDVYEREEDALRSFG